MSFYRRNLPHWQVRGKPLFVTWRLRNAVPKGWVPVQESNGHAFAHLDRILDGASGPCWLKNDAVAAIVAESILYGATTLQRYDLLAWVIMPNHVHVLIETSEALRVVMKTIKCYTARQANSILERTGQFWHHESFDHWVRSDEELRRIIRYIENNPVKAGLAARPEDFRWSSAYSNVSRQACDFEGSKSPRKAQA